MYSNKTEDGIWISWSMPSGSWQYFYQWNLIHFFFFLNWWWNKLSVNKTTHQWQRSPQPKLHSWCVCIYIDRWICRQVRQEIGSWAWLWDLCPCSRCCVPLRPWRQLRDSRSSTFWQLTTKRRKLYVTHNMTNNQTRYTLISQTNIRTFDNWRRIVYSDNRLTIGIVSPIKHMRCIV